MQEMLHWGNAVLKKCCIAEKAGYGAIRASGDVSELQSVAFPRHKVVFIRCSGHNYAAEWLSRYRHFISLHSTPQLSVTKSWVALVFDRCLPKKGDYPSLRPVDTPRPESLDPNQALVKVLYAGVCHSDVALALGLGTHRPLEPVISGHEGAGIIVALGPHSRPGSAPKIGQRVGIKFIADTCQTCEACEAGDEESCDNVRARLITTDACSRKSVESIVKVSVGFPAAAYLTGPVQQYVVASTLHLVPIPDAVALEVAAPILCAGLTSTSRSTLSADPSLQSPPERQP